MRRQESLWYDIVRLGGGWEYLGHNHVQYGKQGLARAGFIVKDLGG